MHPFVPNMKWHCRIKNYAGIGMSYISLCFQGGIVGSMNGDCRFYDLSGMSYYPKFWQYCSFDHIGAIGIEFFGFSCK